MKATLKSTMLAAALTLGTATVMTLGHSLVLPTVAEASVLGKIKGAAKTVGGAAKTVGKGVAKAATTTGRVVAKSPVGDLVKRTGRGIVGSGREIGRRIGL
jgi:hypothetical protein